MPVNRTGAPALHWETRASRNQNSKHPLRPLAWSRHPADLRTWPSDSSRSAQHAFRRSTYVSFVSKATLWDRGLCHDTSPLPPVYHPPLCPRFLSHMKSHPKDLRHPCFQSIRSGPQPPSQKTTLNMRILSALKTQTMKGGFHLHPDRRRNVVQKEDLMARRHSAVFVPSFPLTATPAQSIKSPTPPHHNTLHLHSATRESKQNTEPVSLSSSSSLHPSQDESQERGEMAQASVTSITAPGQQLDLGPAGSPISLWQGSLSDLSRPHSSLFSRSTNLISPRSSILSADINDSDPKGSAGTPHPRPQSSSQSLPQTPVPPAGSSPQQFSLNTTTIITSNPPLYKPLFGQTKPLSSHPATPLCPDSDNSLFSGKSTTKMIENHMGDPQLNLSLDSDHGLVTLAFPSATWSSCPSAEKTTPRSGSGAKLTTSPASWLGSHRWPLLPPISPVTERCGTVASCYSELSCTQSHVFEELEAIAPRSTSCPSLDDSSCSMSLETELSPGLAALTVGCDSGNLGSLSRVQLLLLDRAEAETMAMSFRCPEEFSPEEDYADMRMQHDAGFTSEGVVRPLTVGSISERCDSMGRLQKSKSDQSVGGSGSPSPWIIDQSPSYNMFRSSCSPRPSDHSSNTDDEGLTKEEPNYLRWSGRTESSAGGRNPVSLESRIEERERSMEERKMKVLKVLSKLQDITPRHNKSNCGCSNFEAFDFLAKYCIFSQDKLDEYKRAFEAEDSDGDGYISCLQVLLALKSIIPPDLLSDEEEVYVYRILELVDFRVTDGLVDLRLFAVVASLAQKIATMDEFMRSLISSMDFRSLEVRLFKAKEQRGDAGAQQGFISAEQLLLELKAGGICLEQEAAIRVELQHIPSLDLLDFLAYLPLFMLIHKSVISNPLDNSGTSVTAQTDL